MPFSWSYLATKNLLVTEPLKEFKNGHDHFKILSHDPPICLTECHETQKNIKLPIFWEFWTLHCWEMITISFGSSHRLLTKQINSAQKRGSASEGVRVAKTPWPITGLILGHPAVTLMINEAPSWHQPSKLTRVPLTVADSHSRLIHKFTLSSHIAGSGADSYQDCRNQSEIR